MLARFEDHAGVDGAILGGAGAPWHLEFTRTDGHVAGRAPSPDHLLALYLPDHADWLERVARMKAAGFAPVRSFNPYWDRNGLTFEDPDGYRVVLWQGAWSA